MTAKWRIAIGSDDAGLEYKEALKADLQHDVRVAEIVDVGVGEDDQTPYPHVAVAAARLIAGGTVDRALLVCGTGLGVAPLTTSTPGRTTRAVLIDLVVARTSPR